MLGKKTGSTGNRISWTDSRVESAVPAWNWRTESVPDYPGFSEPDPELAFNQSV